jgi:hypothetical protein
MESKNKDILFMAIAGIGLYLFFKKKSTITPVVPPTTGGGIELRPPMAPSPVYEEPIDIIKTPVEPSKPIPIDVLPILSNPILDIIGITPIEPEPILKGKIEVGILDPGEYGDSNDNFPIKTLPIYTKPEPIEPEPTLKGSIEVGVLDPGEYGDSNDNFPIKTLPIFDLPIFTKPEPIEPEPTLKGSIEVGVLDKGEYGGGDYFESTPSKPVYQPPIDIYIPPIVSKPELKGSIEIGPLDEGQYGPAEDMPTNIEKKPILSSMFDNLLFNPQQSSGSSGGGGSASSGDFGAGGGIYKSGQNFLYDFIWYNPTPTLKGSIEIGNLDEGEFL